MRPANNSCSGEAVASSNTESTAEEDSGPALAAAACGVFLLIAELVADDNAVDTLGAVAAAVVWRELREEAAMEAMAEARGGAIGCSGLRLKTAASP